jgi:hypothetical protein
VAPRHVFVQVPTAKESVEETATLDRGEAKKRGLHRPWAGAPRGIAMPIKYGIGRLLRWVGLVLFASPVLVAVRFIIGNSQPRIADWLVVIFVLVVCTFFAILNLFVVASVAAYVVRNRERTPYLVPPRGPLPNLVADDASERSAPGTRVLVRGTAVRLEPRGDPGPILTDAWTKTERRTEADDFAIRREGDALPVVVRLETAPLLLSATELREGDQVIVVAEVREHATSSDRMDLGGDTRRLPRAAGEEVDDAPYRSAPAGPAIIVGDTPTQPVTIIVTRKA